MKVVVIVLLVLLFGTAAGGAYLFGKQQATQEIAQQSKITPLVTYVPTVEPTNEPVASNSSETVDQGGIIEGNLIYPSEVLPPQTVCAENIQTKKSICTSLNIQVNEKPGYRFTLPPGEYEVYAFLTSEGPTPGPTTQKAYYNEFVTCGLKASCTSHKAIVVTVESGKTSSDINPHDWYSQ